MYRRIVAEKSVEPGGINFGGSFQQKVLHYLLEILSKQYSKLRPDKRNITIKQPDIETS